MVEDRFQKLIKLMLLNLSLETTSSLESLKKWTVLINELKSRLKISHSFNSFKFQYERSIKIDCIFLILISRYIQI